MAAAQQWEIRGYDRSVTDSGQGEARVTLGRRRANEERRHASPDLQCIVNPSNDPERRNVWIFGLRLRTLFQNLPQPRCGQL